MSALFIVLLGPPGAGKGTQARRAARQLDLPHVSSGDIFRENLKGGTELGELAKQFMDRGELVPDDVTIAMIQERLSRADCIRGALLDGFPRTPAQAEALDELLAAFGESVRVVPFIRVPEEVLIERLSGRLVCRAEGHTFHKRYDPPDEPGVCDVDGSELYQREDDKEEVVANRIAVYYRQTTPLIDFYRERGLLEEVDGDQPVEEVTEDLLDVIPTEEATN